MVAALVRCVREIVRRSRHVLCRPRRSWYSRQHARDDSKDQYLPSHCRCQRRF